MSRIKRFFQSGFKELKRELGSKAAFFRTGYGAVGNTDIVITPKDGSLTLDYDGNLFSVNASALIPPDDLTVKIGDKLLCEGQAWMVLSYNFAPHDYGISLDLVAVEDKTPNHVVVSGKKLHYILDDNGLLVLNPAGDFATEEDGTFLTLEDGTLAGSDKVVYTV